MFRDVWENIRIHASKVQWSQFIWKGKASPKMKLCTYRATIDQLPFKNIMIFQSKQISNMHVLCDKTVENKGHLFFECEFSKICVALSKA